MAIPYFDAHCDTIWRCMVTEPVEGYGETEEEQRDYFQSGGSLRKNGGHVRKTPDAARLDNGRGRRAAGIPESVRCRAARPAHPC